MSNDCEHRWLTFPWYKLCSLCYDTDVPVIDDWGYSDRQDFRDPKRPWVLITTRDEIFMDLMALPFCPSCGSMVVEENLTRSDGTRAAGFTCQGCVLRWWVNDEAKD